MTNLGSIELDHIREGNGWAVFYSSRVADANLEFMNQQARQFDAPSERDGGSMWPIAPRAEEGTFSQTDAEAGFHTDAQYHPMPEPRFLLFCVRASTCGGGVNRILHADHVRDGLDDAFSPADRRLLERSIWSWRMPQVFLDEGETASLFKAPVFDGERIRWRFDNLSISTPEQGRVASAFREYLENHPAVEAIALKPGEVLLCDNWHALHARTSFRDRNRLLYRTRLW